MEILVTRHIDSNNFDVSSLLGHIIDHGLGEKNYGIVHEIEWVGRSIHLFYIKNNKIHGPVELNSPYIVDKVGQEKLSAGNSLLYIHVDGETYHTKTCSNCIYDCKGEEPCELWRM